MTESARLKTSVPPEQHERFAELAAAQGVSASKLLARLVWTALKENPDAKVKRLLEEAAAGKAPAEKYTVRLMGAGCGASRSDAPRPAESPRPATSRTCCARTCEPIRRCPMVSFRN